MILFPCIDSMLIEQFHNMIKVVQPHKISSKNVFSVWYTAYGVFQALAHLVLKLLMLMHILP